MEDFPSNSHRVRVAKTEIETETTAKPDVKSDDKKITPVVTGDVVRRKKSIGKRFTETFISGISAKEAMGYVIFDILIPAAKDAAADSVSQGIEKMLFGEARSASRRGGFRPGYANGGATFTSYNRFSQNGGRRDDPRDPRPQLSRQARASHSFDEIILSSRPEAEAVLDQLYELLNKYEVVTVSDLYETIGVSGNFVDQSWGWTDLRGSGIERVRSGYLLALPRPEPIR